MFVARCLLFAPGWGHRTSTFLFYLIPRRLATAGLRAYPKTLNRGAKREADELKLALQTRFSDKL
jgi:hypothetical protein